MLPIGDGIGLVLFHRMEVSCQIRSASALIRQNDHQIEIPIQTGAPRRVVCRRLTGVPRLAGIPPICRIAAHKRHILGLKAVRRQIEERGQPRDKTPGKVTNETDRGRGDQETTEHPAPVRNGDFDHTRRKQSSGHKNIHQSGIKQLAEKRFKALSHSVTSPSIPAFYRSIHTFSAALPITPEYPVPKGGTDSRGPAPAFGPYPNKARDDSW